MVYASRYLEDEDVFVVVWGQGAVLGAEWEAQVRARMAEDPDWPPGSRRLVDATAMDPDALTAADVATNTDLYGARPERIVGTRTAIVAGRAWEIATEFERRIDRFGSRTIVFNYLTEACKWLGVDPELARATIAELRQELSAGG
jgi:hypothetical protein